MTKSFGVAVDGRDLTPEIKAKAMIFGFLMVAARAANDMRELMARGESGDTPPESLVSLLEMLHKAFPDLALAHQVIAEIGLKCGFQIEERNEPNLMPIGRA